jgi:hypothetical protein
VEENCLCVPAFRDNLTTPEREAIKYLKNHKGIKVAPADKGGAVVVMDRDKYVAEGIWQLTTTTYYKEIDKPMYLDNLLKINTILKRMWHMGYISQENFEYLQAKETDSQMYFYLLPKIHKPRCK